MAIEFDKKLPGETLEQFLNRHHCGLNDPLNPGMTAEEFDAAADVQNDEVGFIIAPLSGDIDSSLLDSLIRAAIDGNPEAHNRLGDLCRESAVSTGDLVKALRWYRRAADGGDATGQNNVGSMYLNGLGTVPNPEEAVKFYRLAADQGLPIAQYNLGVRYREGEGVPLDLLEAAKWLRLAAEAGEPYAQNDYGVMLRFGNGVPQDIVTAAQWFLKAAKQNDVVALGNLSDMEGELESIAKAGSNKRLLADVNRILRKWQP
jgi:TPR repeat protein